MFYLIGIIITFFLAVILLSKRGKTRADKILLAWLGGIGMHLFLFYFSASRQSLLYPHVLGFELPLPLLHGPFLYLYTGALTNQISTGLKSLLHFTPILLIYLLIIDFFPMTSEQKLAVYASKGVGYETVMKFNVMLIIPSGLIYVLLSLRLLNRHKQIIQNQFSYTDKINLNWLRYLIYGICVIWISVIFGNDTTTFSSAVLFVILMGYFGINQTGIFTQGNHALFLPDEVEVASDEPETVQEPENSEPADAPRREKYSRSGLTEESARKLHELLVRTMDDKKLFTNPDITLAELAEELNTLPNNLSQVINSFEGKSFYDYINEKRVEEFKNTISRGENEKFTLLSLAYDCGFNSKASFNRNFKNSTGLSPSEYLKQVSIVIN